MIQPEHPSIDIQKIKDTMNIGEIQEKLMELQHKLISAHSFGNPALITQLNMVIAVYQRAYTEELDKQFNNDDGDFGDVDIT